MFVCLFVMCRKAVFVRPMFCAWLGVSKPDPELQWFSDAPNIKRTASEARANTTLRWAPTCCQLADALTKDEADPPQT